MRRFGTQGRVYPESRTETELINGVNIRSYVIPVTQAQPSTAL